MYKSTNIHISYNCKCKYMYIYIYIYIPSFLCKTSSSLLCSEGSLSSPNESRRIGQLWLLYMCTQDLRFKYARYPLMCMHIYIYVCIYIYIYIFLWIYVYRVCMYIQIICNHLHMHNIYVYILYVCKCMICTRTYIKQKIHIFMYVTLSPSLHIEM